MPDNISLNSYEEDEDENDDVESLSRSLPDTDLDLSLFDPIQTEEKDKLNITSDLKTSSSWLFAAMNTCAGNIYKKKLFLSVLMMEEFITFITC